MQDYTDLQTATSDFRKCCESLNDLYETEKRCLIDYKHLEGQARLKYWEKLMLAHITKGIYDESIKNFTFESKLNLEKAKFERKLLENKKDSLRERLYTTKKLYDLT